MEKKNKKLLFFVLLVLLLFALNHYFKLWRYLSVEELSGMKHLVKENFLLASLIYIGATVAGSVLLALPGVSFAIAAGILFGAFWGTILCTLAAGLGAMISFVAGRYFLQDKIKPMAMKNPYLRKYLFEDMKKNEIYILMLTRLVPLFPFNLQNFAYGVTDMRFTTYSFFTFIFILPGTAMYTVGTAGFVDAGNRVLYIGISLALAFVVFTCAFFFKKYVVEKEMGSGEAL